MGRPAHLLVQRVPPCALRRAADVVMARLEIPSSWRRACSTTPRPPSWHYGRRRDLAELRATVLAGAPAWCPASGVALCPAVMRCAVGNARPPTRIGRSGAALAHALSRRKAGSHRPLAGVTRSRTRRFSQHNPRSRDASPTTRARNTTCTAPPATTRLATPGQPTYAWRFCCSAWPVIGIERPRPPAAPHHRRQVTYVGGMPGGHPILVCLYGGDPDPDCRANSAIDAQMVE